MAKLKDLFEKWGLQKFVLNVGVGQMEWAPADKDKDAAWEMYIELLTRVTTQYLEPEEGDEATALQSIYSLFETTRDILKRHGKGCEQFAKVAILILNGAIRPFTAKWHRATLNGWTDEQRTDFRDELRELQANLRGYTKLLGEMTGAEPLALLTEPA